jgi:hypothetical protein
MTHERWRTAVEGVGLFALVGSLFFVGMQMRQDRSVALADLTYARNELFINRFSAGLASEAYLDAYAKLYSTHAWDTTGFTAREAAAIEIDAMLWWSYLEVTYRHHAQGFVDPDEWATWGANVRMVQQWPAYNAVLDKFWRPTPSDFTRAVDQIRSSGREP